MSPTMASLSAGGTTARRKTIEEMSETEDNYVRILCTILKLFKEELEKPDQQRGPILDPTEAKMIFGKIPPIYDVHRNIRNSLQALFTNGWDENCSVGDIYIGNIEQFRKAYPPFVNFFSTIKESIEHYNKTKPRFRAFLKLSQSKPECGRQSLTDLLITLVQRLPRVILLLKDIHKNTHPSNPDKATLEKAYTVVDQVMTLLNEDQKTTESYLKLFEVYNEIENAPAGLLASYRTLLQRVDVVEISDGMLGKGEDATIFLLSDQIEICKRRIKVQSAKSPGKHISSKTRKQQAYKHILLVPINDVKNVLNIKDTQVYKNMFGLITRERQKLYVFTIVDEKSKTEFLDMICKAIEANKFRGDRESLLVTKDHTEINLQLDSTELGATKKIAKAAARVGKRVSRALSFKQPQRNLKITNSIINRSCSTVGMNSMITGGSRLTRGNRMANRNDLADDNGFIKENQKFPKFNQFSIGTPSRSYDHNTVSGEGDPPGKPDEMSFKIAQRVVSCKLKRVHDGIDSGYVFKKRKLSDTDDDVIGAPDNYQLNNSIVIPDKKNNAHNSVKAFGRLERYDNFKRSTLKPRPCHQSSQSRYEELRIKVLEAKAKKIEKETLKLEKEIDLIDLQRKNVAMQMSWFQANHPISVDASNQFGWLYID